MEIIHTKMGLGGLKAFTPGIYDCYSNELYHAYAAVSKSDLDLLHRSAAHYRASMTTPREETADMRLGTALHCSVLEPERFTSTYIVVEGDRRTKAVKETVKAVEEAGKIVMSPDDMDAVQGMTNSIMESKNAVTLFQGAGAELSAFADFDGTPVKCRPDIFSEQLGLIIDLKTTVDASHEGFARACRRFRYHVQDAWYRHVLARVLGVDADDDLSFVFCAVEKTPPYAVAWYTLDPKDGELGWNEALADLHVYQTANETGLWSGYSPKIETLSLFKN